MPGFALRENMCGMARKVLRPLRDGGALMQIGCENDRPEKRSGGDSQMRQHLSMCLSLVMVKSLCSSFSPSSYWGWRKFEKHRNVQSMRGLVC